MIRLTVLYHDDTREPFAVEGGWGPQKAIESWAQMRPDRKTAYGAGSHGEACKELLLRERRHWTKAVAALDAEAAKEGEK